MNFCMNMSIWAPFFRHAHMMITVYMPTMCQLSPRPPRAVIDVLAERSIPQQWFVFFNHRLEWLDINPGLKPKGWCPVIPIYDWKGQTLAPEYDLLFLYSVWSQGRAVWLKVYQCAMSPCHCIDLLPWSMNRCGRNRTGCWKGFEPSSDRRIWS